MKRILTYSVSIITITARIKRKTELVIIQLTNTKPVSTLQSIIISMAN
ncbi:MAG: hypothetical protein WKG06_29045 [Segetibacter sp.]